MSVSAGLIYTYSTDYSNFDIGASGYHLNKPRQTVLDDPQMFLASRYVGHANFETVLNNGMMLMTNGIYQYQSKASYFSIGGALGFFLDDTGGDRIFNTGVWYWSKNAIVPYIGLKVQNMQFGLSYDVTISKLSAASDKPKTFELTFIIRGNDKPDGVMWCPWK